MSTVASGPRKLRAGEEVAPAGKVCPEGAEGRKQRSCPRKTGFQIQSFSGASATSGDASARRGALFSPLGPGIRIVRTRSACRGRGAPSRSTPGSGCAIMQGCFFGTLFAQALGILKAQLGRPPRLLVRRHDTVARRQLELLGRRTRQALELVQIKSLDLLPRPVGFFQKLDGGLDARVIGKAIDVQVGKKDLESIVLGDLGDQLFQAESVQRIVLIVGIVGHDMVLASAGGYYSSGTG